MEPKNKEAHQRREKLLAARAQCLAKMSENARRAFDRSQKRAPAGPTTSSEDRGTADGGVAQEIRNLITEAHRLREKAENNTDTRAALKGLDTALKALQLYGRATGEITDSRRAGKVKVEVVPTRAEGIATATELLLELATAEEIPGIVERLQQRLRQGQSAPAASPIRNAESSSSGVLAAEAQRIEVGHVQVANQDDPECESTTV